jgi:hypothetical protein
MTRSTTSTMGARTHEHLGVPTKIKPQTCGGSPNSQGWGKVLPRGLHTRKARPSGGPISRVLECRGTQGCFLGSERHSLESLALAHRWGILVPGDPAELLAGCSYLPAFSSMDPRAP